MTVGFPPEPTWPKHAIPAGQGRHVVPLGEGLRHGGRVGEGQGREEQKPQDLQDPQGWDLKIISMVMTYTSPFEFHLWGRGSHSVGIAPGSRPPSL